MDTEPDAPPSNPPKPAVGGDGAPARGTGESPRTAGLPITEDVPPVAPKALLTPTMDAPPVEETVNAPPVEETVNAPPVEETVSAPPVAEEQGLSPAADNKVEQGLSPAADIRVERGLSPAGDMDVEQGPSVGLNGPQPHSPEPPVDETVPVPEVAPVPEVPLRSGAAPDPAVATRPEVAVVAPKAASGPDVVVAPDVADAPTGPEVAPEAAPKRRRWLWGLAVFFGIVIAAGVAVLVFGPGYVRGRIEEEARARGVVLAFGEMDLGMSRIRLHGVRVALAGVRDFEAAAAYIDVDLADGQPTAITAGELSIAMSGTEVISELGAWKSEHAAALAAPVSGERAKVEWRPSSAEKSALWLSSAKVAVDAQKGSIDALVSELAGKGAGPLSVAWTSTQEGFVVQIVPLAPPLSAARVEVRSSKEGARVKLTLARTALGPLQDALGIPKGSEGIQVDGEVEMPVPSLAKPAPVDGSLRLAVKGYTPPHPRELDGILFGDTTVVRSKFQLAADFNSAKLMGLTAEAGALSLTGSGEVTREGLDARVSLKLKGSIPCTSLATSAAVARLGSGLGRLAGGLAAGALTGSVGVALTVDARASDIKGAKIKQSASIGCKVSIPGLPTIVIK